MPRTFYRTVKRNPPGREDFLSDRDAGKRRPRQQGLVRLWEGLSVFETLEQARQKAIAFPAQGDFIATIVIPDDSRIRYERTGRSEGHHTLWGTPNDLLQCVVAVESVRTVTEDDGDEDGL